MYRVIKYFTDLQDKGYAYDAGDFYPRVGLEPSPERIKELSSKKNARKEILIVEVQDSTPDGSTPPGGSTPDSGTDGTN